MERSTPSPENQQLPMQVVKTIDQMSGCACLHACKQTAWTVVFLVSPSRIDTLGFFHIQQLPVRSKCEIFQARNSRCHCHHKLIHSHFHYNRRRHLYYYRRRMQMSLHTSVFKI